MRDASTLKSILHSVPVDPRLGLVVLCLLIPASGSRPASGNTPKSLQVGDSEPSINAASGPAHAVILFIGDGMGEVQRTAATWSALGPSGTLSMDSLPARGLSATSSASDSITDSAAGATAIATGVKTNNGHVSVDPEGNPLTTILERAHSLGMAVGLVTTTQMAHATPASFASHVPDRSMMTEIARQMLEAEVQVLLGGGEDEFLPDSATGCYPEPGERSDGRDLIAEAVAGGYAYVCDAASFASLDPGSVSRLLGLFADEGMIRPHAPSLAAMTQKAIGILSGDPEGFFLLVEAGQIDWAGHSNDAQSVIQDTIDLDAAVSVARSYASHNPNTLIIVTADHETGGMSLSLGGSGAPSEYGPFLMPDGETFFVNWTTAGHTGADVPTTAEGPWAGLLNETYENTHVHDVMLAALLGATFADVLPTHWSWSFVETLAAEGLTAGYADGTYRPEAAVARAQMAVFLMKGIHGPDYTPGSIDGSLPFSDTGGHWAEAWIEDLFDEGLTSGYPGGTYRPESQVSRAEAAVFLLKAVHGSSYTPPAPAGGSFSDIADHWAEAWIAQLKVEGITFGYPDGTFRPERGVTRAELAAFLVNAFGLAPPSP